MKGLSVLVVDDSIVRGNTTMMLVDAIRRVGAKHVFVASAAPPIRFCNVYGIDMPTQEELIAYNKTEKEVTEAINAEYVLYQTLEDLKEACTAAALCRESGGVESRWTCTHCVRVLVLRRELCTGGAAVRRRSREAWTRPTLRS